MKKQVVLGNWKMYGSCRLLDNFATFFLGKKIEGIGLSLPSILINHAKNVFHNSNMLIGAQDVSDHEQGAYTGCLSAAMLAEARCNFCLVGHSERRQYQQESSQQIAQKIAQLNKFRIQPVLCIGENLQHRQQDNVMEVIKAQLTPCIDHLKQAHHPLIAYEPVWAIGTGKTASNEQAQDVHKEIRRYLAKFELQNISLLYGGSVKPDNAVGLLAQQDIDGTLVGGAALEAQSLYSIAS